MSRRSIASHVVSLLVALVLCASSVPLLGSQEAKAASLPKLSFSSCKLSLAATKKLKVKNAAKKAVVTYTSKNKKVATVTKKGLIKAVKPGKTKVVVSIRTGGKTKKLSCVVKVAKPAMAKTSLSLTEKGTATLALRYKPAKAAKPKYSWASSNKTVATVKSGKVTALKTGTTNVTCTVKVGKLSYKLTCTVNVKAGTVPQQPEQPDLPDPDPTTTHEVTFISEGETIGTKSVADGALVELPDNPTVDGYAFDCWCDDASLMQVFDKSQPITSDVCLYARWLRNRPTVFELSVDTMDAVPGQTLTFALNTDLETGTPLLCDNATGERFASFSDDGETAGDEQAGDGIYTCSYEIPAGREEGELAFIAILAQDDGSMYPSNQIDVYCYALLTAEQIERMDEVDSRVDTLLQDEHFDGLELSEQMTRSEDLLSELEQEGLIAAGSVLQNDDATLTFAYADGVLGILELGDEWGESDEDEDPPLGEQSGSMEYVVDTVTGPTVGKALMLNAFIKSDSKIAAAINRRKESYQDIKSSWENKGLEVTLDEDVSVNDLYHFDKYDVVFIGSHGNLYQWSDNAFISTFFSGWKERESPGFALNVAANSQNKRKYSAELKSNQLAIGGAQGSKHLVALPRFFERHYGSQDLSHTFVFTEACSSAGHKDSKSGEEKWNSDFADALLGRGAKSVLTFYNEVNCFYARDLVNATVLGLLDGETIWDAYSHARNDLGATDADFDYSKYESGLIKLYDWSTPAAIPELSTEDYDARLIPDYVVNGDFERFNWLNPEYLPSWYEEGSVLNTAGFGSFMQAGLVGKRMALLTTEGGGASIAQIVSLPWNATQIQFDYCLLTEGSLDDALMAPGDRLSLSYAGVRSSDGLFQEVATVAEAPWVSEMRLGLFFGLRKVKVTDWQKCTIKLEDYDTELPPSGVLQISLVRDGGSTTRTYCLIDNVSFVLSGGGSSVSR